MQLHLSRLPSPLGELLLVTDDQERVQALDFADQRSRLQRLLGEQHGRRGLSERPAPPALAAALARYFDGELTALEHIATATAGSELQRRVWQALREIPPGRTTTYGELARRLGFDDPRAAIEVGAACGANPILVIDPCHRVIAKNGELKGYAGGLHRKRWLLEHEGALAKATPVPADDPQLPGMEPQVGSWLAAPLRAG